MGYSPQGYEESDATEVTQYAHMRTCGCLYEKYRILIAKIPLYDYW